MSLQKDINTPKDMSIFFSVRETVSVVIGILVKIVIKLIKIGSETKSNIW